MSGVIVELLQTLQEYFLYILDFVLVVLAFLWRRSGKLNDKIMAACTNVLIYAIYPALIVSNLTKNFRRSNLIESWDLPAALAVLMGLGLLWGWLSYRGLQPWGFRLGEPKKRSYYFMSAMPNFVFLPLLLCQMLWDDRAVGLLILSSFGGDLFMWLVAVPIVSGQLGQAFRAFFKPPVIAMLLSLVIILMDSEPIFNAIAPIQGPFHYIGQLTVPISMLLLGGHLGSAASKDLSSGEHGSFAQLMIYANRFLLMPLIAIALVSWFNMSAESARIILLIAIMPTAIASAIITPLFRGDSVFCSRQVFHSHLLGILFVPLWFKLLSIGA